MEKTGQKPDLPKHLSPRQQRRGQRFERQQSQPQATKSNRRDFLKALVPGGWVSEAKKGVDNMSTAAKVSFAKDLVLVTGGAASLLKLTTQENPPQLFREKVLSFNWEDLQNEGKLRELVSYLASEYITHTKTSRLTRKIMEEGIEFVQLEPEYFEKAAEFDPRYGVEHLRGFADYELKKVYINNAAVQKRDADLSGPSAGLEILSAVWHQWGHLDITPRKHGEYINNPNVFLKPHVNAQPEQIKEYHGGLRKSNSYTDSYRFEDAWLETITLRLMDEKAGFKELAASMEYYVNGADILLAITKNVPFETLYTTHATSDLEGFGKFIGRKLPGSQQPFFKAEQLFDAINQNNPEKIQQTGVYDILDG